MNNAAELNFCYGCMRQVAPGTVICPHCGYDNSMTRELPDILPAGSILRGNYLVGKMLGRGGFGVTYLGYDFSRNEKVAIKEYYPINICTRDISTLRVLPTTGDGGFEQGMNAFREEANNLSRFNYPNIVRVRDFFPENGTAYIVMDFIEGNDLNREIKHSGGRLPWQRVLSLFGPLIETMEILHAQQLIHRDFKPGNIKVVPGDRGKAEHLVLMDFGSARQFVSENVTGIYTAVVSPGFAPIEQYNKKSRQGPYTDVYGLCATMYGAITGQAPPPATEIVTGESQILPFRNFGIDVPASVEKAILHGMETKATDRTQTMRQLYDELYQGMKRKARPAPKAKKGEISRTPVRGKSDGPVNRPGPAAPSVPERSKSSNNPVLILSLLAVLVAGGIFFLIRGGRSKENPKPTAAAAVSTSTPVPPTVTPDAPDSAYHVGEFITFGHYEQDNDLSNGPEAIEWQVLAVESDRVLVISRYGLDTKRYNEENVDVAWEDCTLRSWLNGEFYSSAFSPAEQRRIRQVTNINPKNPHFGTAGGNDTQDRVFLLSFDEARTYFASDDAGQCYATDYAKSNGAYVNKDLAASWWWLRSPGSRSYSAAYVNYSGNVNTSGFFIYYTDVVVRPAFWLDPDRTGDESALPETVVPTVTPTSTSTPTPVPPTKTPSSKFIMTPVSPTKTPSSKIIMTPAPTTATKTK